ncbi:MAG TPA: thioredoxin family protein [Gammaproteobacteria bacterium]|nr:thioredoxin family protein [Gammaproteobacteria bacterium]
MDVKIVATRTCTHRPDLEKELQDLGVDYEVLFVEDHPEVAQQYGIRHSPNLIVDGKVVCRELPTEAELRQHLGLA